MVGRDGWEDEQLRLLEDVDDYARRLLGRSAAEAAAPAPNAPDSPDAPRLLDRMKQLASAKQEAESSRAAVVRRRTEALGAALEQAWSYLRDLTQQLNIVQPVRPRPFPFHGSIAFAGLTWRDGEVDYRLHSNRSELRIFDKVTLRFRLAAPQPLRIEREAPALGALREALDHWHVPYLLNEARNERGNVVAGSFVISPELRGFVSLWGDEELGVLRLRMSHVERFGSEEFEVPPAALDLDALEDLGKMMIGEPSRFLQRFRRIA